MAYRRLLLALGMALSMAALITACGHKSEVAETIKETIVETSQQETSLVESTALESSIEETTEAETTQKSNTEETKEENTGESQEVITLEPASVQEPTLIDDQDDTKAVLKKKKIGLNMDWKYAEYSAIHDGKAVFYPAKGDSVKNITVCVNAGHGTKGGSNYSTYSHPDKTGKVTGGTNANGAVKSTAIAEGTSMEDGTPEAAVTLKLALILKEDLLEAGYNVLMIRESEDVQLDNIARTVIANNNADCHIALHYDGTASDKGAFYCSVADVDSYRSMEPVASMWREHNRLGQNLVDGLEAQGVKIWGDGELESDLTQTSFSTIPSVDLEVGDQASDYSKEALKEISQGILAGVDQFWE